MPTIWAFGMLSGVAIAQRRIAMFEPGTSSHKKRLEELHAACDEAFAKWKLDPTPDNDRQHGEARLRLTEFINKPFRPR